MSVRVERCRLVVYACLARSPLLCSPAAHWLQPQLIKELKAEMPAWVSKYARGGSARTVSARKLYVVVDAISGHFAANG